MESQQTANILVAGYPGVGKTTYLAALWYVLNHSDEIQTQFRIHRLNGDDIYLNKIVDAWLSYSAVERTKISQEPEISIEIVDAATNSVIRLAFPDLDGERFRQYFEERQCNEEFAKLVCASNGYLIFIHCGSVLQPTSISEAHATINALSISASLPQSLNNDREQIENAIPWQPSMCPTQVQYVELLQFMLHIAKPTAPVRLAIILSAWDLVSRSGLTPVAFLSAQLPLLNQFLMANRDGLQSRIFGISAQGIDLCNDTKVNEFADLILKPSDRIIVCEDDSSDVSHDISLPMKWIV